MIGIAVAVYGGVNLYFMELFNGVLDESAKRRQTVNVLPFPGGWVPSRESELLACCDQRIDGLILVGPDGLEPGFLKELGIRIPLVTVHASCPEDTVPDLQANDEAGLFAATTHLIELGHRRIAHLPGPLDSTGGRKRLEGYRLALAEHGIPYDPDLVVIPGSFSGITGIPRTEQLLDTAADWPVERRPTAFTCANDGIAFRCLRVLDQRGIRVPDQISVTGFDDVLAAQTPETPLTTVHHPLAEMGSRAVQLLLDDVDARLQGSVSPENRSEVFDVSLVVRATTAPPRSTI